MISLDGWFPISTFWQYHCFLNNLKAEMLCFADFDVLPSQRQKATGGFDMLGSGRHKIETQEGSTDLVAAKPVHSLTVLHIKFPRELFFLRCPSGTGRKMERVHERSSLRLKQEQFQDSMMVRLPVRPELFCSSMEV